MSAFGTGYRGLAPGGLASLQAPMTATWSCQCLGSRCWLPSGSGADSAWRCPWTHGLWAPNLPGLVLQRGEAGERDLAKHGCIQLNVWHISRNSRRRLPFSPSLLALPYRFLGTEPGLSRLLSGVGQFRALPGRPLGDVAPDTGCGASQRTTVLEAALARPQAPATQSLSCPPRGWYSACFLGLCY